MIRTLLVLGRFSNIPTVWSNCLAAYLLSGSGNTTSCFATLAGASLMYTGGMYLNDWCDASFDREHRAERPIPSGRIKRRTVLILACVFLVFGLALIAGSGKAAASFGVLLLALIVCYNIVHKRLAFSVLLMAGCRSCLYFISAAPVGGAVAASVMKASVVMFLYITAISVIARGEAKSESLAIPPWLMLFLPIAVTMVDSSSIRLGYAVLMIAVLIWMTTLFVTCRNRGPEGRQVVVGSLLAGIPLIDILVMASTGMLTGPIAILFTTLAALARAAQKKIPAT